MSGAQRRVLDNGLTVVAERRGIAGVVFSGVVYRVGSRDEGPGRTGISHLLEHMMFKGTEKYAKGEVASIVERHGGELNAFTSEDVTMYYEVFASDRWQMALEIEAERMANLRIDPAELESERNVVLEERLMYLDIPSVELSEELSAAAFRESPYRWPIIGWESDIRAITRDDMLDHYRRYYAPNNAALVVVGNVDPADVFAAAEKHFGGIAQGPPIDRRVPKEPEWTRATRIDLHRATTLPQLQVMFRAPEIRTKESEALYLVANILSGSRTSRLDLALVETGKVGDIQVQLHPKADPSAMLLAVEGQPDVPLEEVEEILWSEIARMARDGITDEERDRALNQVEAHHAFAIQSPSNRGFVLGWHEAHGDVTYADALVGRLRQLTAADLAEAVDRWLDRSRSATAHLHPAAGANGGGGRGNGSALRQAMPGGDLPLHGVACPRRRFHSGVEHAPTVQRRRLDNGLTVLLQPDRTDPVVAVSLLFEAGASHEPAGSEGLATLTADTLERGTRALDFVEFTRRFERIGSNLSIGAGAELVHGGALFLERHAATGLNLLADVLEDPGFREEDLALVRSLALNDLDAREDDLDDVAEELFFREVAGDHPYARLPHGTRDGITRVTREDVVAFHRERYRPDRAYLAIVGAYDDAELERCLARFAALPNPAGEVVLLPELRSPDGFRRTVRTRPEKGQAKLFLGGLGFSSQDPDRLAAVALNHVLGGSSIRSRLGDEIRDNRGLAYSVYSRNYQRSRGGLFAVHMGTGPRNVRGAVEAIRSEIAKLPDGVTDQELKDARDYLTGSFPLRFTSYGKLARLWARSAFYGWPEDYLQTYVPRVRALEASDLRRVGERVAAGLRVLAVAGPVNEDLSPVSDG